MSEEPVEGGVASKLPVATLLPLRQSRFPTAWGVELPVPDYTAVSRRRAPLCRP